MNPNPHAYSAEPTRNPFRYVGAVWRLIRNDPSEVIDDAAIVEMGFARSRFGRRFARWGQTIDGLRSDPRIAAALAERRSFGPIVLDDLEDLPEGTLGRVFVDHCRARRIDPNLVHVPPDDEIGWFLNHLFQTHDIWHVLSGWGNDLPGEVGLGSFYCGQLRSPAFFGYMLALVLLNVISRKDDLAPIFAAIGAGYRGGVAAEPLFGVAWDELWGEPIDELRARFGLESREIVGEGIREAA